MVYNCSDLIRPSAYATAAAVLMLDMSICPGSNHMYVFVNPLKAEVTSDADVPDNITWEFAQREIAQAKGFVAAAGASSLSVGKIRMTPLSS